MTNIITNANTIPEGSIEIQEGLYLYIYTKTIAGLGERTYGELYSAEGYCFWWNTMPENYDEEGNLLPLEQRIFARYSSVGRNPDVDAINAEYFSVPIQPGYEIVSENNPPVTA